MRKITVPTIITLVRIALVVPFVILLMQGDFSCVVIAAIIFVVAAFSDFLDGFLARKTKQITDLGAFLDPLADKMLVNSAFICLSMLEFIPYWVPVIFICRDYVVDGIRMAVARKGETVSASIIGKAKTATQMIAIVVLMISVALDLVRGDFVAFVFMFIAGKTIAILSLFLSLLSGVEYVSRGLKFF